MCLLRIYDNFDTTGITFGWKVFKTKEANDHFSGAYSWSTGDKTIFTVGNKYKRNEPPDTLHTYFGGSYLSGFHVFLNESDAYQLLKERARVRCEVVKKVKFKTIIAVGSYQGKTVAVTEDMTICV